MQTFEEGAFELLFVTNTESKRKQELGEAGDLKYVQYLF